eukprot:m.480502 g.480502  ORF g.480502 m.480502 type:complete len:51 (+) comp21707_c0_seq32:1370-1522(+)
MRLTNISGLNTLHTIGGDLRIDFNANLTAVSGLPALQESMATSVCGATFH